MNTSDEQAIMNETASFAETWSKGDSKVAASFYTEDGMRVGAFGLVPRRLLIISYFKTTLSK